MILHRRKIPRVVSAGLVLTSGCYETVVFDGASGRFDAGRPDLGTRDGGGPIDARVDRGRPDAGPPDLGEPDLGPRRLEEVIPLVCSGLVECGVAGITYDECAEYVGVQAEYYLEAYGEACYEVFLTAQLCAAETLVEDDCDIARIGEACADEFAAIEDACR